MREPRAVLHEFGLDLPAPTRVVVSDSTAEIRYMVVPIRPAGTESMGEDDIAALVQRNALIGTAVVAPPSRSALTAARAAGAVPLLIGLGVQGGYIARHQADARAAPRPCVFQGGS